MKQVYVANSIKSLTYIFIYSVKLMACIREEQE